MWNRDPASLSFGSFDRQYWGWKYKDFSDATLQYAVRLAVEYARLRNRTSVLPCLLEGFVSYCGSIQRRDGSFDQCYPYEKTPGVVYDILSTLIFVRDSPYLVSRRSRADLDSVIAKAARFVLRTDEVHGAIANHLAEYSFELFNYARHSSENAARVRAEEYLERTLRLFDREEGWFEEYGGPDAGYQTRTLRYLAKIALLENHADLWDVLRKAADFVRELLMPDGSMHPMLGSRSTALIYPSAFEALAAQDVRYRGLADRICIAWEHGRLPIPSRIDFVNAIRLADDALEAGRARVQDPKPAPGSYERKHRLAYPRAGIAIERTPGRQFYLGSRLGGVVVVYHRQDGAWNLAYEDSGYMLKSSRNARAWLTRMPGSGRLLDQANDRYVVESEFQRSLHDELTPLRMVLLRLLNLTILRFQTIADLFRRVVVRHLMSGREAAPLRLRREIVLTESEVRVTDNITGDPGFVAGEGLSLYRCRRITGVHMASARYFQEHEIERTGLDWVQQVPLSLNQAFSRSVASPHESAHG